MMQAEINIVGINLQFLVAEKGKMDEAIEKYEKEGRVHTHRFVKEDVKKDFFAKVEQVKNQKSSPKSTPKVDKETLPWYVRNNVPNEMIENANRKPGILKNSEDETEISEDETEISESSESLFSSWISRHL